MANAPDDSMTEEQKQLQAADREGFMDNRQAAIKEVDPILKPIPKAIITK